MAISAMDSSNAENAAARSKARRATLLDSTKKRQLLQQSPDQLVTSIADSGYRKEIDIYSTRFTGAELIEVALAHNLSRDVAEVTNFCQGLLSEQVKVYTARFAYQNAKTVLRAVENDVDVDVVESSILPVENELNAKWVDMVRGNDSLRSAVEAMAGMPWWHALMNMSADSTLQEMEDALDMHYYSNALSTVRRPDAASSTLRRFLQMEIDQRNVINVLRANREGLSTEKRTAMFLPGGRIFSGAQLRTAATIEDNNALLDIIRRNSKFDAASFEEALRQSDELNTLDPAVSWMDHFRHEQLRKLSFLHPLSSLPVIYYIASKVEEVEELRMMVRGLSAGLSREDIGSHMNI